MRSIISAIGTANPPNRFAQSQILEFMADAHQLSANDRSRLKKLYELSGIEYRHSVIDDFGLQRGSYKFFGNDVLLEPYPTTQCRSSLFERKAIDVCLAAVKNLHEQIPDFSIDQITHLITVSCTGLYAPGIDIDLIEKLSMNPTVERTCINFMGCYGAFNALKTADYICRAESQAKVLIVDIELCTIHFQRENTLENWLANSLFGDGAAAVLVENESHRSTAVGFNLASFFSELQLESKNEMAWRIGNTGFEMRLSSHIAKHISKKINGVIDSLLEKSKVDPSKISSAAIHPGGRRILEVCQEKLDGFCLKHSFDVLRKFGNMSSATILFVLQQLLAESKKGSYVMGFAFGPGLTIESMLLQTI
ncbi:type III polyketide synthase [Pedobacter sp. HMF7647]|uniref:Type III polyketide synthase n=1 Tax=Hufsiella arboris TaxID=2695275 RepID=A0A7K1Y4Q8_9SPHI|nr:type III polyketide synthase [Hufsiella arboris]MXV49567.1 type III polyketide synthase [Hufsiella arboris]